MAYYCCACILLQLLASCRMFGARLIFNKNQTTSCAQEAAHVAGIRHGGSARLQRNRLSCGGRVRRCRRAEQRAGNRMAAAVAVVCGACHHTGACQYFGWHKRVSVRVRVRIRRQKARYRRDGMENRGIAGGE